MRLRPKGLIAAAAAVAIALTVAACGSSEGGSGGVVQISFWDGQTQQVQRTVNRLVAEFNRTHPHIHVTTGGVNTEQMLQKVTAGLQAGDYPDIAYIYGSDLANVASSKVLLNLDKAAHDGELEWDKFQPAAQQAAIVGGQIRAVPSLIDNLAVVYNKKLFREAKVPYPSNSWSWTEFAEDAKRLTNSSTGVIGTAWPGSGSEDTTWRIWPMIWQLGGQIVEPNGKHVGFAGQSGLRALEMVRKLSAEDHSVYIDTSASSERQYQVFDSGKLAMSVAGPWALPEFVEHHIEYGVADLPSFNSQHTTISGPDVWAIFNHGSARAKAAIEFISWFTAPRQNLIWDEVAGSLPTRVDVKTQPGYQHYVHSLPDLEAFVANLANAKVRPTVTAYPAISQAMGQAVAEMLFGRSTAEQALKKVVSAGNAALSGSGVP